MLNGVFRTPINIQYLADLPETSINFTYTTEQLRVKVPAEEPTTDSLMIWDLNSNLKSIQSTELQLSGCFQKKPTHLYSLQSFTYQAISSSNLNI